MDNQKAFGKRIKELRKNKKLTQEKLAELINVEPQQICRIENGACFTTFDTLEKLAQVLETSIADFFNNSHIKTTQELIDELTNKLNNASEKDIMLIYKVVMAILQ